MAYNGSVELISGIKQANNGTFPLVDASAVRVSDNKRLDTVVSEMEGIIAGSDEAAATESHAVGDLFICGSKLYKATAAIAVGDSIVEGTNVTETTVAGELSAIWAALQQS